MTRSRGIIQRLPYSASVEERLWRKVDRSNTEGCWVWTGTTNRLGYGQFFRGGHNTLAHRVVYEVTVGPIPKGMHVLHRCDNPPCCNPAHLYVGTDADNVRDAIERGRFQHGETNGHAKLSAAQVRVIRRRYALGGVTQSELAREYGVTQSNVSRILDGSHWRMTQTVALGVCLILAAFMARTYIESVKAEPSHQQEMRERQCRYQYLQPGTWTSLEERRTTACVLARWTVPGGTANFTRVIACESGWNRLAYNSGGPYVGLGQHALSAWTARVRSYSPPLWKLSSRWQNSRTMITVTARMMSDVGLSPWSCA